MTDIDKIIEIYAEQHPDVWKRTQEIARLIDPAAFSDARVHPADAERLHRSRLRYMQAVATSRAQDILKYLGVNTDVDWLEILGKLADLPPVSSSSISMVTLRRTLPPDPPDPFDVVATALQCPKESLSKESKKYRHHGWDSLGHVKIIEAMEAVLGVNISDDEVPKLETMDAICKFFDRQSRTTQTNGEYSDEQKIGDAIVNDAIVEDAIVENAGEDTGGNR